MRANPRRKAPVYTVTDAQKPMSEDIGNRQRRYLISMGVRTVCLVLAVLLWGRVPVWLMGLLLVGAIILPYISVVFANGGREPEKHPRFYESTPDMPAPTFQPPETALRKQISGPDPEISS